MSYHFLCKRGIRHARTEQFLVVTLISPMDTLRGVGPLSLCGMDSCGEGGHWRNLGGRGRLVGVHGALTVITVEAREAKKTGMCIGRFRCAGKRITVAY